MFSINVNMYRPFESSSLGSLIKNDSSLENLDGLFFEDIDFSHQHLSDPNLGIFVFFLRLILVCIGDVVQVKVWYLLKNEKSLTSEVVKLYIVSLIVIYFCFIMIAFNSFIVSLMRYLFIVHEGKVKKYGKKNIKRFFLVLSILSPFLMRDLWRTLDPPAKDPMSWLTKCNDNHHKVYSLKVTSSHLAEDGM